MARKLRIQYPGAMDCLMNRGNYRETIFCDDEDRQLFISALAEGRQKTARQVHGFCLMSNQFHPVIETPHANLVEGMKWFLDHATFSTSSIKLGGNSANDGLV